MSLSDEPKFRDEILYSTRGTEAIIRERTRQIRDEGFSEEHDDQHDDGQLAMAASCYAQASATYDLQSEFAGEPHPFWPWDPEWWKPGHPDVDLKDKVRVLAKAGALIAAEIDRLERLMART